MAIHILVESILNERKIQRDADKMADTFDTAGHRSGESWSKGFSDELIKSSPKIQKALNGVATAQENVFKRQVALQDARIRGASGDRLVVIENNLTKAYRDEADALRNLGSVSQSVSAGIERDVERGAAARLKAGRDSIKASEAEAKRMADDAKRAKAAATDVIDDIQKMGTEAFRTIRGLGSLAVGPLVVALVQTATVATTASQAIALLPAVAVAAAAGMGTLALATDGFGQAIKDMGDPKKFAEDLAKLSPNAQQAALSIKSLIPAFDSLKASTQDALFAGIGQEIQQLSTTYLPSIQGMTTSIASSFNKMFTDTADSFMTPENTATIKQVMTDISGGFTAAAPAVQQFSQAFLDITAVGSSFLPQLGAGLTDAATEFANFISEARKSGELKKWIQEGIDAVVGITGAIKDVVKAIYETFGGASQGEIKAWRNTVNDTLTILEGIIAPIRFGLKALNADIPLLGTSFEHLINPLQILADLVNSIRWFLDPNYRASSSASQGALDKLNAARAKVGQPPVDMSGNPTGPAPKPGTGGPDIPLPGGVTSGGIGTGLNFGLGASPGMSGWGGGAGMFADATPAKGPTTPKGDVLDNLRSGLDPSLYKVDPGALALAQGTPAGADPQGFLEAQRKVITQAHEVEEAKKDVLALEKSNTATAEDIADAKWKQQQQEWQLQASQADLVKAANGTGKDMKAALGELGAALDPDLGISKGLAGMADNLVRFLGALALAGPMAKMSAAVANDPLKGGYGLMGILGAQGAFGAQYTAAGQGLGGGGGTVPMNGYGADRNYGLKAQPGQSARDFAHQTMMPFWQSQGLQVGDHAADSHGEHQNGALDIMVDSLQQGQQVLAQVLSDPNVKGAIFNNQTYGYGHGMTPQDYSGGHTGDPNQDHTNHVHALYAPGDAGNLPGGPGGGAAAGSWSTASIGTGTPVYVTNWPGGGGIGGGGGLGMSVGGGGGVNPGQGAEGWRNTVAATVDKYAASAGIPANKQQQWVDAIVKQIDIESKGDPNAFNGNDSNGKGGTQQVSGLLQYLPSSYAGSGGKLTGLPMNNPVGQIAGALMAPRNPDGSPASLGQGGGWGPDLSLPVGITGGGGEGPIFGAAGPSMAMGTAAGQGMGVGDPFAPGSPLGMAPNIGPGPLQVGPPGGGGQPGGQIGPFGVPSAVAATQGGLGTSALTGLTGGGGPGQSGWGGQPQGGPGAGPTQIGAAVQPGGPSLGGGGGIGITPGGSIDTLMGVAASAFPGVGQAAQTGMKLASRAIQYGGQLAGIAVDGLMQTFLPTGGSELANSGWLPRIAGAVAGAAPALPNLAGGKGGQGQGDQPQGPLTPEQAGEYLNKRGGRGGNNNNNVAVQYNAYGQTEDQNGAALAWHQQQAMTGPGMASKPGQ